jgi:hypothetical protein
MQDNSNMRLSRWSWNADSVHYCYWIVSSVTLYVFLPYLEHPTYFWNASSATRNTFNVIWNASNVNTIHDPIKRRIGMCLV